MVPWYHSSLVLQGSKNIHMFFSVVVGEDVLHIQTLRKVLKNENSTVWPQTAEVSVAKFYYHHFHQGIKVGLNNFMFETPSLPPFINSYKVLRLLQTYP